MEGGAAGGTGRRDRGCESGVVCRGMVLLADIFIGGHATCNRARGIRTERCFAHLYPRSGDSPVRPPPPSPTRSALALSLRLAIAIAFAKSLSSAAARSVSARADPHPEKPAARYRYRHIGCFAFFRLPPLPPSLRCRQNFLEICVSRSDDVSAARFQSIVRGQGFRSSEAHFRSQSDSSRSRPFDGSASVQVSFHRGTEARAAAVKRPLGRRLILSPGKDDV